MKKIAILGVILVLMGSLAACSKNSAEKEVDTNNSINESHQNIEKNDTEVGNETDANTSENEMSNPEAVDGTGGKDDTDDNEGGETDGTTNAGSSDGTESKGNEEETTDSTDTDGSSESSDDTGDGNTGDSSDTSTETDTETSGEETQPEVTEHELPDYTATITKPYDDLDYSPQDKTTFFKNNPPIHVKAVFITANTAASSRIEDFVTLINETELNALVIDVKNDDGTILFHSKAAEEYVPGANSGAQIKDMEAFMKLMKDNDIYTIARIVTFKSPKYAVLYPERAIWDTRKEGVYYADSAYWASPFDQELWKYNVDVAKEAVNYGFNEVQFDYVRFPATGTTLDKSLDFKNPGDHSKTYAIQEFVKYARKELHALEAFVALDVFGWTATTTGDSGIGQHWEALSNVADYMCPMVYPSHYGPGIFGLAVPDANPYATIYGAMTDSIERNANIQTPAKLRPWLQAFTATWVPGYIPYRRAEIQAQIKACEDLGIEDYIFWKASNNYTKGWFDEE